MAFLVAARSAVGEWLSLVEHLVRDQGVGGSNPLSPTNSFLNHSKSLSFDPDNGRSTVAVFCMFRPCARICNPYQNLFCGLPYT